MKRDADFFEVRSRSLICIAKQLKDALRLEQILTGARHRLRRGAGSVSWRRRLPIGANWRVLLRAGRSRGGGAASDDRSRVQASRAVVIPLVFSRGPERSRLRTNLNQ